jgi:hypothetical protein
MGTILQQFDARGNVADVAVVARDRDEVAQESDDRVVVGGDVVPYINHYFHY